MPLQATSGAASYDGFGGGVVAEPNYIESCFSTYLYKGIDSTQTINNGIDLAGKGGLTWIKVRDYLDSHRLFDTSRGVGNYLTTIGTFAQFNNVDSVTAFNSTGFNLGNFAGTNGTAFGTNYVSWTFRKQPKFFDVVTYTGNGSGNRIITSSLGSPIGCVFIKRTDSTSNWATAHRKDGSAVVTGLNLNTTAAALYPNSTNDTFDATGGFNAGYIVDSTGDGVNFNGATYVAYLFAHNAGGFGLTGTDNVISCGSFTCDGSGNATVNLGFEPQWIIAKEVTTPGYGWQITDNMRGLPATPTQAPGLLANTSAAEVVNVLYDLVPTSTGFNCVAFSASKQVIYIAIRRGPMKVPTSGTSVFSPVAYTGNATARTLTTNFPVDLNTSFYRPGYSGNTFFYDRLRGSSLGGGLALLSSSTAAESGGSAFGFDNNVGIGLGTSAYNGTGETYINYMMRRAPSFFDVVCYTGTGSGTTITHNLGVTPELVITKSRTNGALGWVVWTTSLTNTDYWIRLDSTMALTTSPVGYGGTFSASNYTIANTGPYNALNGSGQNFVAYLFATCAGVSKVGSYTGNGSSQTINCGFTGGARFVMVKATSTTGDWMVADSARGIVAGSDPYLELNNTNAEVTGEDWLDTDSTGFVVNQVSASNANTNGVTYIFLAIA